MKRVGPWNFFTFGNLGFVLKETIPAKTHRIHFSFTIYIYKNNYHSYTYNMSDSYWYAIFKKNNIPHTTNISNHLQPPTK